jgi:hypothetical protein
LIDDKGIEVAVGDGNASASRPSAAESCEGVAAGEIGLRPGDRLTAA